MRDFHYVGFYQWANDYDILDYVNRGLIRDADPFDSRHIYKKIELPKRATAYSAGYDIFSPFSITLFPGEEIKIPLGIRIEMNPDEYVAVHPRSGHGFKYYVRLSNTTGIIDYDYFYAKNEGHCFLKIRNESPYGTRNILNVEQGQGICQAIFNKYYLTEGDDYGIGKDRTGGIGSTDEIK